MPTRWHMMSEKQLSILIQGRNYARGNRQIIIIPRAFACISAGAPWLWRSVMQIDKVSQEPARLRMLTAPFHGTFFPLEVHSAVQPLEFGNGWIVSSDPYDTGNYLPMLGLKLIRVSKRAIPRLLMTWRHMEPGHQQLWNWFSPPRMF